MPMSETPKKIEFMMMKDSAAEFVIASNVAFIDSDESYFKVRQIRQSCILEAWKETYNTFLLDDVD